MENVLEIIARMNHDIEQLLVHVKAELNNVTPPEGIDWDTWTMDPLLDREG